MQIRFRASDFGQVAKKNNLVCANRNRLLLRNRTRRWYSGHLFVCPCDSAVWLLVRLSDMKNSRQGRLLLLIGSFPGK